MDYLVLPLITSNVNSSFFNIYASILQDIPASYNGNIHENKGTNSTGVIMIGNHWWLWNSLWISKYVFHKNVEFIDYHFDPFFKKHLDSRKVLFIADQPFIRYILSKNLFILLSTNATFHIERLKLLYEKTIQKGLIDDNLGAYDPTIYPYTSIPVMISLENRGLGQVNINIKPMSMMNKFLRKRMNLPNLLAGVTLISVMAGCLISMVLIITTPKHVTGGNQKMVNNTRAIIVNDNILPRTFLLDPSFLVNSKDVVRYYYNNDPILQVSLKQLLIHANSYLLKKAPSVIEKTQLLASGNKHDYLSLAPYDWPDPTTPNGSPYISHDGIVNPDIYSIPDRQNLNDMINEVRILSLAYYFTDNLKYASKAEELLRVWFLNNGTNMNPNLQYAEAVLGRNNGSSSGIIEGNNLPDVLDAIGLIQHSPPWTTQDQRGVEQWFSRYFDWLLSSDDRKKEAQATNNHGSWYDVQASCIALFLNKTDIAKGILQSSAHILINSQVQRDGRQPFELRRTNSWDYSLFNLQGLFNLARIGQNLGIDLWNYKNPQGAGLQRALDYLLTYSLKPKVWPYPQIAPFSTKNLADLLCQASIKYKNNQSYIQTYKFINTRRDGIDNLLHTCSTHLS